MHRELPQTEPHQQAHGARIGGHLAAQRHRHPTRARAVYHVLDHPQQSRVERLRQTVQPLVTAIHRERVLDQVVGSDAEKIHLASQGVGGHRCRRNLDHDAQRRAGLNCVPLLAEVARLLIQQRSDGSNLLDCRDHRQHDLDVALLGLRAQQSPQLRSEDIGPGQRETHATQAEYRIRLVPLQHPVEVLLATQIQRPDHRRFRRHLRGDLDVGPVVLFLARQLGYVTQEEELGPIETDPASAKTSCPLDLDREFDVGPDQHLDPVARHRGQVPRRGHFRLESACRLAALLGVLFLFRRRLDDHLTGVAVDQNQIPGYDPPAEIMQADHRGQRKRTSQDRRMRGATSAVGGQCDYLALRE